MEMRVLTAPPIILISAIYHERTHLATPFFSSFLSYEWIMNGPITRAAGQRYLCSGETRTWLHVAGLLRELFPEHAAAVPATCADGATEQPCLRLDNAKIRTELGLEFTPLKQTLLAQGNAFIEAGLLPEK